MPRYTLMNKNKPVLDFDYDLDLHVVLKVREIHDLRYAPPAIVDMKGNVTKRAMNTWWTGRAIPASRDHITELLSSLNLESTLELAEKNFGLSLSDRYWINDPDNPQSWDEINFFDNQFSDELGLMTLGQSLSENPNLMSPNSTLGGDLNKKWKCIDGERVLLKAGTGLTQQEVLNEAIATRLYERVLKEGEYVPYRVFHEGGRIFSACGNMLGEDEELVTAYDIISTRRKPNNVNDYQFLVQCYEELGLKDVETTLEKMFTCDFILANQDRHWRNFGVIRNVETLEYTGMAPIFDSGTSLWCRDYELNYGTDYVAKPFGPKGMKPEKQLALFHDFSWLNMVKLDGFSDEVREILGQNPNIPVERVDMIGKKLDANIEHVGKRVMDEKEKRGEITRTLEAYKSTHGHGNDMPEEYRRKATERSSHEER